MSIESHAQWIEQFYRERDWYAYPPITRLAFLTEEVGELAQAIRAQEIGRDHPNDRDEFNEQTTRYVREELSDVLDNLLILARKYNIPLEELTQTSENKLRQRFPKSATTEQQPSNNKS